MPATMDDNREALLGLRIMTLLHRQHKSVYALAKHAGLPLRTVQRICQGEGKQPSVWTIAAIARVLGVSLDALVGWQDEAQSAPSAPRTHEDGHNTQPTVKHRRTRKVATVAKALA
jgi:hypothetical protein